MVNYDLSKQQSLEEVKHSHLMWNFSINQLVQSLESCISFIIIIIPSQMEVAPLHCTVDITQKRSLSKNTKEIENM